MSYNYFEGKKRVLEILNNETEVVEKDKVPIPDNSFSFNNGFYSWVTAIFVDIKDSTKLFSTQKRTTVARIIRGFTSEIIEILRDDDNLREIGIRGDCVYAIYSCSQKHEDFEIAEKSFFINTFLKMFNKLLSQKQMPTITAGIGIATSQDLVVKAGRKGTANNDLVWIGKAVTYASKLSSMANRNGEENILMSELFYKGIIDLICKNNPDSNPKQWFTERNDSLIGRYFGSDLIKTNFNRWINNGMKDEY